MEVLEINSDEIVDRFVDKIEERIDDLLLDFEAELDEIEE